MNALFGLYGLDFIVNFADDQHILRETFYLFVLILGLHTTGQHLPHAYLSLVNNVSVFWHVVGVAVIVGILIFVPDTHQSFDFVFTERINNSGFGDGMFWFYVLPLGFLLTQYTITGFDASAHISEETHDASRSAARGVWQSIFYSALIGWIVLLAITFAATDVAAVNDGEGTGLGSRWGSSASALSRGGQGGDLDLHHRTAVLRRSVPDQRLADVLRLLARRRAPRLEVALEGEPSGVPRNAVITMALWRC